MSTTELRAAMKAKDIQVGKQDATRADIPDAVIRNRAEEIETAVIERHALATAGTVAMSASAMAALQGLTTAGVPKDPKEREAFFAAGKRPWSIRIGSKWVPMMYFGPFFWSLAVPAAWKQTYMDDPDSLTRGKVKNAARFALEANKALIMQTSVTGFKNFMDILTGGGDENALTKALGFISTQYIPGSSMQRWVNAISLPKWVMNGIFDGKYRKSSGMMDEAKKSIVGYGDMIGSLDLPGEPPKPYTSKTGEEQKMPLSAWTMPYALGTYDKAAEEKLSQYQQYKRRLAERRKRKSEAGR
jgi:hypothetical protein